MSFFFNGSLLFLTHGFYFSLRKNFRSEYSDSNVPSTSWVIPRMLPFSDSSLRSYFRAISRMSFPSGPIKILNPGSSSSNNPDHQCRIGLATCQAPDPSKIPGMRMRKVPITKNFERGQGSDPPLDIQGTGVSAERISERGAYSGSSVLPSSSSLFWEALCSGRLEGISQTPHFYYRLVRR